MAYDQPYRLERDEGRSANDYDMVHYTIYRTGEGMICRGTNFTEMRNLVDRANEAAMQEMGDRGR
jgi:hypothetical protein